MQPTPASEISYYIYEKGLSNVISHTLIFIGLYGLKIDLKMLKRIIEKSRKVRDLAICHCIIESEDKFIINPDLHFNIRQFNFFGSGFHTKSSWHKNFYRFENIIESMATSESLRKCLKMIWIKDWGIPKKAVQDLCIDVGFKLDKIEE